MAGYLTPDTAPAETICRRLFIPDNDEFIAVVTGALETLIEADNWTKFGTLTPEEAANALVDMFDQFSLDGECETVLYPKGWTMWHDESTLLIGDALQVVMDTLQQYNFRVSFVNPDNGYSFKNRFYIGAGTYNLAMLGLSNSSSGKLDLYVDDVLKSSGHDFYSAAVTRNILTGSNMTLTDGWHTLRGVVNGKNATSTGYQINITKFWLSPFPGG